MFFAFVVFVVGWWVGRWSGHLSRARAVGHACAAEQAASVLSFKLSHCTSPYKYVHFLECLFFVVGTRATEQAGSPPSSSHLASVLGWRWFFSRTSPFFIVGCSAQSRWRRSPRSKLVSRVVSGQVAVIFMPCSKNKDEAPSPKKFSMQ